MAEILRYGNHLSALQDAIKTALAVRVAVIRVPDPRPAKFVLLEPSGGNDESIVHGWRSVVVDSWGASESEAFDLALGVEAHLKALRNERLKGVLIYKARPSGGIVWMPDPDAKVPRFRQNYEILTRSEAI